MWHKYDLVSFWYSGKFFGSNKSLAQSSPQTLNEIAMKISWTLLQGLCVGIWFLDTGWGQTRLWPFGQKQQNWYIILSVHARMVTCWDWSHQKFQILCLLSWSLCENDILIEVEKTTTILCCTMHIASCNNCIIILLHFLSSTQQWREGIIWDSPHVGQYSHIGNDCRHYAQLFRYCSYDMSLSYHNFLAGCCQSYCQYFDHKNSGKQTSCAQMGENYCTEGSCCFGVFEMENRKLFSFWVVHGFKCPYFHSSAQQDQKTRTWQRQQEGTKWIWCRYPTC